MDPEIRKDLRDVKEAILQMRVDIAKQTVDWNHHVKRTDLNDKRIDTLQRFMWLNLGGLAVIQFLLVMVMKFF